jgi:mono/diheme cytochrome c family protein
MSRWPDALPLAFLSALVTAVIGIAQSGAQAPIHGAGKAPSEPRRLGIGREASSDEIAGWAIAVRPDGQGLPPGRGTVKQGEEIYLAQCASCHGEFGESSGRWPILSGGAGTLGGHDPVRSIGSYWPYASTVFDYIRRAMPYGNAQSLTPDEIYAVTAYVLFLNDIITDEDFELNRDNFPSIRMPNQPNFYDDDRETAERAFWNPQPCMANCAPGEARITGRARALEVTPEPGKGPKVE